MLSRPSPAIVAQEAVRRLPRPALWLLCVAYVLAGWLGRAPWKSHDMASFGLMHTLALGRSNWLAPRLMETAPELGGLLPYWLGAWAIKLCPSWIAPDLAARIPFGLLLALSFVATWYAVYYLARNTDAQPVPFAFGGEAKPTDYARSMADGGLLALVAMLGLAQLSHEVTANAAQMAFAALLFYGCAASVFHLRVPAAALVVGSFGLALSGTPAFGMALAFSAALARAMHKDTHAKYWALWIAALGLGAGILALALGQWQAQWGQVPSTWTQWRSLGKLGLWFTWPAWPLAAIALWKWRSWWRSLHIVLPTSMVLVILVAVVSRPGADRTLLLALPMLASLAAFALPTMQRSVMALVDWFTLLFFSGCAVVIWVVWLAMHTGWPAQPAANVKRLFPGFEVQFSFATFFIASCATLAWAWLVYWRAGRHRAALWKSLVLPAGGAAMSWLLLTTLWMPLVDFARSYAPLSRQVAAILGPQICVHAYGLTMGQAAGFQYHGNLRLAPLQAAPTCPWLIVDSDSARLFSQSPYAAHWTLRTSVRRPSDDNENVMLFQRTAPR